MVLGEVIGADECIMADDFGTFLYNALDIIEQTSTVEEFFHRYETIRHLISIIQPWLTEAYFASRFIYCLRGDIQGYVSQCKPFTVLDAFQLACVYEYNFSTAYAISDVIIIPTGETSTVNSMCKGHDLLPSNEHLSSEHKNNSEVLISGRSSSIASVTATASSVVVDGTVADILYATTPSISIDISTSVDHIVAPPSSNYDFVVAAFEPPVSEVWHGSIPILDMSLPIVSILLPELQNPSTNSAEDDDKLSSFRMTILHSMELKDLLCPLIADAMIANIKGADTKITVIDSNCLGYEGEPKEFADSFISMDLLFLGSSGWPPPVRVSHLFFALRQYAMATIVLLVAVHLSKAGHLRLFSCLLKPANFLVLSLSLDICTGLNIVGPSTHTAMSTVAPLVNKFSEYFHFDDPYLFSTTLTSISSIKKLGNVMDICEEVLKGSSTIELLMSATIDEDLVLPDSAIFQVINHLGLGLTTRQGMSNVAHDSHRAELMICGIELGKVTEFLELVCARSAMLQGILIDRLVRQFHLSSLVFTSIWIGLLLAFKGGTFYLEHGSAYITEAPYSTEGASQWMFSALWAFHHTTAFSLI